MRSLKRFFRRLGARATLRRDEERLRAEVESHLALQTDELIRSGLTPAEARRQAVLKFGPVEAVKESYRDGKRLPLIETFIQDTRFALRGLRKAPAFTLVTVVTLALGIGATTSIFTLVHAVLLKSLAVANPDQLYRLGKQTNCCVWGGFRQDNGFSIVSYDLYKHFRDHTPGFVELAAFQAGSGSLFGVRRSSRGDVAQSFPGKFVSGNYFSMFGIQAFAGRVLTSNDDHPGSPPVAVISYRLWQQKYAADPSLLGAVLDVNSKPITVIGVTPPGFFGDTLSNVTPDVFLPLATEPLVQGDNTLINVTDSNWLHVIGRLRPGIDPKSIQAQMRVELTQWLRSHWGEMDDKTRAALPKQTLYLSPGGAGITSMREEFEHWLKVLMMVSTFVLLIVCANVANLMLVRGMEQRQQTSLRIALGSRISQLVRQTLTETVLLSLLGGFAGIVVAFAGTRLILRLVFPSSASFASVPISPSPSLTVLFFAFGLSIITGLAFGIAPALMAASVDPIEALRGVNRSTNPSNSLSRKTLVILQAALALVLLSASGLLTATLRHLETQDFGFEQDRRTIVAIDPQLAGYHVEQLSALYRRLQDAFAALPGVESTALCAYSPLSGDSWTDGVFLAGHPDLGADDSNGASFDRVTGGYFEVIGTPIVQGRGILDSDTEGSRHVAVINEAFARKFFKNETPIGKYFGRSEPGASRQYEIVGVAKDARYLTYNLDQPIGPFFFTPQSQHDVFPNPAYTKGDVRTHYLYNVVIKAKAGASLSETELRRAVAAVDPNLPVAQIRALRHQVSSLFSQQRLIARLTSLFGILSLVLASIGLYGVTAYNAERRTSEIGIRMALGAGRRSVIALVLRGAFALVVGGLALGIPLSFAAGRFLGSQLYGINPFDPVITVIAIVTLGLSAIFASMIPAIRASLISPLEALRAE